MDDEEALLRAICEQPEDTPRLVFADFLQEQGGAVNVAWALGIRAQVAVARGTTDGATLRRARVLDTPFARDKVRERLGVPPSLYVAKWECGFPAAVVDDWLAVAGAWPRLADRVPVRKLHISELSAAHAAEFVTWPGLSCLRDLGFALPTDDAGPVLPVLAGCASLAGLERLRVSDSPLTEADAVAVLDSPHLAGLRFDLFDFRWEPDTLPPELATRLVARFGPGVIDDAIPF